MTTTVIVKSSLTISGEPVVSVPAAEIVLPYAVVIAGAGGGGGAASFATLTGQPSDNAALDAALDAKANMDDLGTAAAADTGDFAAVAHGHAIADVALLPEALQGKQDALAYTPEDAAQKGQAGGYASLDGGGKVPAAQLPAFVDDVIEAANFAALPGTGQTGVIYVTLDDSRSWRWSGSSYVEISPSPGSTDSVPEGSTNLYHTQARVLASVLTGLAAPTDAAISAADTMLAAFAKLQGQVAARALTSHGHSDATTGASGFMSAADKTKLNGVAPGATANATDAALRDRASHTGAQPAATIGDLTEAVQDIVAALLQPGANVTLTYDDAAGSLTVAAAGGGGSPAGTGTEVQFRDGSSFGAAARASIGADGNILLGTNAAIPATPPADKLQLYARRRAGADWLEVQRPNGRDFPLAPHMGYNRVGFWAPVNGTTVSQTGIPRSTTGTTATPSLSSANLASESRRWRLTSANTANSAADERTTTVVCLRGGAPGRGGFIVTTRVSLVTLQPAAVGFFGLTNTSGAFSGTQAISALLNCIGFGFTNGVDANWQMIHNDASGAPTKVDCGANFPVNNTTNIYTITIRCSPNDTVVWAQITNQNDEVFAQQIATDLPSGTTFLAIRNAMHNGGAAAAVAFDCSGVYLETDY